MHDNAEIITRSISLRASKLDVTSDHRLTGYAITFNSRSQNLGGFYEVIAPSAVDRTLKAGSNVDALQDHRRETTTILGSTDTGLLSLRKDRNGLAFDLRPPDTSNARDLVTVVKSGLAKGMSFSFRVFGGDAGQVWEQDAEGDLIRTVTDMEFFEVSVVINPAYLATQVSARNEAINRAALAEFRSGSWKPSLKLREQMLRASL